jgi:hypothetical protein
MPTRWRCARVRGLAVPLRNFSAVEAKSEIALPAAEATPAELQAQAAAVAQSARLALLVGGLGTVLSIVGSVVGVMGPQRRRPPAATCCMGLDR